MRSYPTLLLCVLVFFFSLSATAQSTCRMMRKIDMQQPDNVKRQAFKYWGPMYNLPCKKARIRVVIHVVRNSSGLEGLDNPNIQTEILNSLNTEFNQYNIFFEPKQPSVNYIDNTTLLNMPEISLSSANGKFLNFSTNTDAIDIYIIKSPTPWSLAGGAPEPGSSAIVCKIQDAAINSVPDRVINHEMGHCLGLEHTFFQTACEVSTAGDNRPFGSQYVEAGGLVYNSTTNTWQYEGLGSVTGDFIEDTWPDPTINWPFNATGDADCRHDFGNTPYNLGCDGYYPGDAQNPARTDWDKLKFTWRPLINNYMDYFNPVTTPSCMALHFTPGQVARMMKVIAVDPAIAPTLIKETGTISILPPVNQFQCSDNLTPVQLVASSSSSLYYFNWQWNQNTQLNTNTLTDLPTGTTTYTVTATSGCMQPVSASITIEVNEKVKFDITGPSVVCAGSSVNYSINDHGSTNYSTSSGMWTVVGPATINNGTLNVNSSAVNGDAITITYTATTNNLSCHPSVSAMIYVVDPSATVSIVASQNTVCAGEELYLTAVVPDGLDFSWSDGINTYTGSDVLFHPTTTTTYSLTAISPCGSPITSSVTINVNPLPVLSAIMGLPTEICVNNTAVVSVTSNVAGVGSWSVGPVGPAGVGGSGFVDPDIQNPQIGTFNPTFKGKVMVYYSFTDNNNCTSVSISPIVTIYPTQLSITGKNTLCTESQLQLSASIGGGVWASSNNSIAEVDAATGLVTGKQGGTVTVTYQTSLCGSIISASHIIAVTQTPKITASKSVFCVGESFEFLVNVPGGTWESTNTSTVSINTGGLATAIKDGSSVIRYLANAPYNNCLIEPIIIPVNVISCNAPVACGNENSTEIAGNNLDDTYENALFFIQNDITVTGTLVIRNAQVRISPGVKITVADNAVLEIAGSHLYGCGGMWQGIHVTGNNASVKFYNQTLKDVLIEDAVTAVLYSPPAPVQAYSAINFIDISNTIFNRNNVSIKIENLADVSGNPSEFLPFSIANCVFTSRDIPTYANLISWDNISTIKETATTLNTPYLITPTGYSSPYINNTKYSDNTANAYLKDNSGTNKPAAGIVLSYVGTKVGSSYHKLRIGGTSVFTLYGGIPNTNFFDNLTTGIDIKNSNVVINNCTFQNGTAGSTGINVHNQSIRTTPYLGVLGGPPPPALPPPAILYATTGLLEVSTPATTYNNAFFDLSTAISISRSTPAERFVSYHNNNDHINISNCDIRSSQDIYASVPSDKGTNGIVIATSAYEPLNIINNAIYNVQNGIWYGGGADFTGVNFGTLNISNNLLATEMPGVPNSAAFMKNAINLSAIIYGEAVSTHCNHNTISGAINGIKLSGWKGSEITGNTITLMANRSSEVIQEQYGICVEVCSAAGNNGLNVIASNKVTGYRSLDPAANTTGIMLAYSAASDIGCNEVEDNMHGFRFVGNNPDTRFWDNRMKISNQYGFTLWEDGTIGQQGYSTVLNDPKTCASNNTWEYPASQWNSQGQYMTYCYNSLATKSKLIVRSSTSYPEINPEGSAETNIQYPPGYRYGIADGSLLYATGLESNCNRCNGLENEYNRSRTLLEEIAEGTILLPADEPEERLLVMQDQLYQLLQNNTELVNASNSLQQFMINSGWTNLDFFYYAGKYLSEENYEGVELMLDAWPGQSNIDRAYYDYFEWLINMYRNPEWQPDLEKVEELANQCPARYGSIVYAVRSLYNALTGKINEFSNACDYLQARGAKPTQFIRLRKKETTSAPPAPEKKLLLYPNPATSNVTIVYSKIKRVMIMDVSGRLVNDRQFNSNNQVQLNISGLRKGVYLVRVYSENNTAATQRLIVE